MNLFAISMVHKMFAPGIIQLFALQFCVRFYFMCIHLQWMEVYASETSTMLKLTQFIVIETKNILYDNWSALFSHTNASIEFYSVEFVGLVIDMLSFYWMFMESAHNTAEWWIKTNWERIILIAVMCHRLSIDWFRPYAHVCFFSNIRNTN